jgi:hypothetical protein
MAPRKFSLSHLIAVVRTGNGELVEDVVHRHAIEEDGGTPHGTVVDAGPMPEAEGRSHPTDPHPGTLPRS